MWVRITELAKNCFPTYSLSRARARPHAPANGAGAEGGSVTRQNILSGSHWPSEYSGGLKCVPSENPDGAVLSRALAGAYSQASFSEVVARSVRCV